ncbi:MAG: hypothetical protein J6C33_05535 [Lachnospiraceae bacterium]|nr:hypothetical protein [Lachnospiraceae bacterium]
MVKLNIGFTPHNDLHADDINLVEQHKNLINNNKFSDATTLLDNNNYQKGFRASLLNSIEVKLKQIQLYLLNKYAADPDEYYSLEEPTDEEMKGKTYWIRPY